MVGQSFYFPIQMAEVALRNVVSEALLAVGGPDWWRDGAVKCQWGQVENQEIDKVRYRLSRKYNREPETAQIIASLTLGFCVAMLKRKYHRLLWDAHAGLAFPDLEPGQDINHVNATAQKVHDLRNRIFHHEPVIGRDLTSDYRNILDLLGWICPTTKKWVRHHSSVPQVIRLRPR